MKTLIYTMAAAMLLTSACMKNDKNQVETSKADKTSEQVTKQEVKKEAKEALEATKKYSLNQKEAFFNKIESRADNTRVRINKFAEKMEMTGVKTKKLMKQQMVDLENKQKDLEMKIQSLKSASDDAYQEIAAGVDSAMHEMEKAMKDAEKELENAGKE